MSKNTDNPAVDQANQEFDDFLDGVFTDSDISASELIELLEDFAYRCEVAAKNVKE